MATEEKEDLELLSKMFENGNLKAVIDKTYPLEEIREADAYVETGKKRKCCNKNS